MNHSRILFPLMLLVGPGAIGGCTVDDAFLEGKECSLDQTCAPGYTCLPRPCPDDPAYRCDVCTRDFVPDGGSGSDGRDGGDQAGDGPAACAEAKPPCKTLPACTDATPTCQGGVWVCAGGFEAQETLCDGQDNDCDGQTDNGLVCQLAGNGAAGFQDGLGTEALFSLPRALLLLPGGDLAVADSGNHAIRRVKADGTVSTLAGIGVSGKQDGAALAASFNEPAGLALLPDGTLIIADRLNHKIRALTPAGEVVTLAGTGAPAFQDGPALQARFALPTGVWVDAAGAILVADTGNHCIRRIENGEVTTYAGLCGRPGVADGALLDARFSFPTDLCTGVTGELVVVEDSAHRLRTLDALGQVVTLAGTGTAGYQDGAPLAAKFKRPAGCLQDLTGLRLLVADSGNQRVRTVGTEVGTWLGSGEVGLQSGPPGLATFNHPSGLAFLADGRLVVADTQNHALRVVQP